jgi:hypothetical protein
MKSKIKKEGLMNSGKKALLGEWIAGVSGIAFIIVMFTSWFTWSLPIKITTSAGDTSSPGGSMTAWESFSFIDYIFILAAIVAVVFAFLSLLRSKKLPVFASLLVTVLGSIAFLLILKNIIVLPNLKPTRGSITMLSAQAMREIGIFLGLIASLGIAVGGLLSIRRQKTSSLE